MRIAIGLFAFLVGAGIGCCTLPQTVVLVQPEGGHVMLISDGHGHVKVEAELSPAEPEPPPPVQDPVDLSQRY